MAFRKTSILLILTLAVIAFSGCTEEIPFTTESITDIPTATINTDVPTANITSDEPADNGDDWIPWDEENGPQGPPPEGMPENPVLGDLVEVTDKYGNVLLDEAGNPLMGRQVFDAEGNPVTDSEGNPVYVIDGQPYVINTDEADNDDVSGDGETGGTGEPADNGDDWILWEDVNWPPGLPPEGLPENPVLGDLVEVTDKYGNVLLDEAGNPLMGRQVFDAEGNPVTDSDGNPVYVINGQAYLIIIKDNP